MSTDLLVALPILVPLLATAVGLAAWRLRRAQRLTAVVGCAGLLGAAVLLLVRVAQDGILVSRMGGWAAPWGITLVVDLFSALMLTVVSTVGLAVVIFAIGDVNRQRETFGFYPLVTALLLGVAGAFTTGDLFNLYVWFEVLLIASFVLLTLGGESAQMRGALRYFVLNMMSSALFLAALGILYGKAHTLNLADLAAKLNGSLAPEQLTTVAMLFLLAFGLKAAVFPLFFWLPASYPTPPVAVSALFAGLLTKVGVYALVRVFTLLFVDDASYTHTVLLWVAGLTMVVGILGAVAQNGVRKILSFHIVSQIGYMLMGLALLTPLALAGAVFFILHQILVKTSLFLIGGMIRRSRGTGDLARLGGLLDARPFWAVLFGIAALSLAGLPPTSGFWAKMVLVRAGFEAEAFAITAAALAVSLLTLLSMIKIWTEAFWKPLPAAEVDRAPRLPARRLFLLTAPTVALVLLVVGVALAAGPLFELAMRAAEQMLDRDVYVTAVLGAGAATGGAP